MRSVSRPWAGTHAAAFDVSESDPTLAQIVRRKLQRDLVAGNDAYVVLAHLACAVRDELVPVVERDAKAGVRQCFSHHAIHLENFFLCHDRASRKVEKKKPGRCRARPAAEGMRARHARPTASPLPPML